MTVGRPIPKAPGALPLLGHAVPLLRDPLRFMTRLHEQGRVVQIRFGPAKVVVVCDPELTRTVLRDDRTFDKGGLLFDRSRDLVGDGLITCPHSAHRRQRRLIQPAFHPTRLPGYVRTMIDQITVVTGDWQDGQVIDVLKEMTILSTRIAVATMFAGALSPAELNQVAADFTTVIKGVYVRMFRPGALDRVPTPGARRYRQARDRLRHTIAAVAAECKATGADHHDLLSVLLNAGEQPDGPALTDEEIHDNVISFFIAGAETSALLLSWTFHLLGQHPEIDERHHEQVAALLAEGRSLDFDAVPELILTGHIITETLRLYPPGWIFTRVTTKETVLGGHRIPAGRTVVYSPYLIQHLPGSCADSDRFDPARWDGAAPLSRDAFIPFGGGARKCVGDNFAMAEATIAVAGIAAGWRLEAVPGAEVRPAVSGLLSPHGLRMRVVSRTP